MKKVTILFFTVAISFFTNAGIITVPVHGTDNEKAGTAIVPKTDGNGGMNAFLALTPAKVEEMTGKKMDFKEKLALKMAQKHVKNKIKKGKKIDIKDKNQMLRYWLICWGIGLVLTILGAVLAFSGTGLGFLSWIGWLFWLAGSVFFVLWLIAMFAD
jgi:hypothetical protein